MTFRRFGLPGLLGLLGLLATVACDDGSPTPDPGPLDYGEIDAEARADAQPDAMVDATLDHGVDAGDMTPDALPPCPESPAIPPATALNDLAVVSTLDVGGPAAPGAFLVEDLDGAPDGDAEVLVARGGRIEAFAADGATLWSSPVEGLTHLRGVADVDGDGRREVLATGGATALWLDALTGAILWRLPARPFGDEADALVAVLGARLADFNGDGLPDLYVTDSGCTAGGSGLGVAFSFATGFDAAARLGVIGPPRRGARCARWHTLVDVDGDGWPEVLRPDADGIQAMEPLGGGRVLCGVIDDITGDTNLPHLPLTHPNERRWAVFDRDRVLGLAARFDAESCPDGQGSLVVAWQADLGGEVRPEGSAVVDLDGDGWGELVTSVRDAAGWRVVVLRDQQVVITVPDARLEGVIEQDPPLILVRQGSTATRFGDLMLMGLDADGAAPLWPQPIRQAEAIRLPVRRVDRTPEFSSLARLGVGDDVQVALAIGDANGRAVALLRLVDQAGRIVERAVHGEPGGVRRVCAADGCRPDRLAQSVSGGGILSIDPQLDAEAPAVHAPVGLARLTPVDGLGVLALTDDTLGLLAPDRPEAPFVWSIGVGRGRRNDPLGVGPDVIMVRDHRTSSTGWRAVDYAGEPLWQHRLDEAAYRAQAGGVVAGGLAIRFDRILDTAAWPPPEACDTTRVDPGFGEPLEACPDRPAQGRAVIALDARTGACRWRIALRTVRCGGPSNQNISAVADGLYVTSTNELIELDLATGAERARVDLGLIGGSGRGGGRLIAAPDGARVRFGGNGPVDVFEADLNLRWRAAPQEIRGQSWLLRPAVVVGERVWISPAPRAPVQRYRLNAQGEEVLPDAAFGLLDGAQIAADLPGANLTSLRPTAQITAEADGVLLTTDEGWLYAVGSAGQLAWSRLFSASIGAPAVLDIDNDALREMAVPLSDGRVVIADAVAGAPPEAIWDVECPAVRSCQPDADIDVTESTRELCAEWLPRAGATGYAVRIEAANGAVVRDWFQVGPNTTAIAQGLRLVPGARYFVAVRVLTADGPGAIGRSDGVQVVNDPPPQVEISALPAAFGPGELTRISVRASDDDLLAGWSLVVQDAAGDLVQRLGGGPLAQPDFESVRDWSGEDRAKDQVTPGTYTVYATFEDRAGNVGDARAVVEVCDGACP